MSSFEKSALPVVPAKRESGRAGMNCPDVPAGVTLNVRLETKVTFGDGDVSEVATIGLISSEPETLPLFVALKKFASRSFKATVAPASTCNDVWTAESVALVPEGVNVSW